jgi:dihydroneopterin aldolase
MAWIVLEGMRFHAFHGVYDAERILGSDYIVDIYIKTSFARAAAADTVDQTINYETVFQLCRMEMEKPRQLIESVLEGIIARLKHQFNNMFGLRVRVRKVNPPLGGRVAFAWVEDEADFISKCPRCTRRFINYDDDCWTRAGNIHPATRETLQRQYDNACLCPECLKLYGG